MNSFRRTKPDYGMHEHQSKKSSVILIEHRGVDAVHEREEDRRRQHEEQEVTQEKI